MIKIDIMIDEGRQHLVCDFLDEKIVHHKKGKYIIVHTFLGKYRTEG